MKYKYLYLIIGGASASLLAYLFIKTTGNRFVRYNFKEVR